MLVRKRVLQINRILGSIGAGALIILMFITCIDVIGRYIFRKPLLGAYEFTQFSMAAIVLLGWGYNQMIKGHISIDLVYNRLPRRVHAILDIFTLVLGLMLFTYVSWQAINFIIVSYGWNEVTMNIHLPVWIFKLLVFIGSTSILAQFIVDIFELFQKSRGKI